MCAYSIATGTAIREKAAEVGCDPVAAVDLLAHLRSVFSPSEAFAAVGYVFDLGWRPVINAKTGG